MNKFLFAFIGNENIKRNSYAIPKLTSFLSSIKITSNIIRISWQAKFFRIPALHLFVLSIYYSFLEIYWRKTLCSHSLISSIKILCGMLSFRSQYEVFIYRQLTSKHIRAWEAFIDSDAEFLVVMEDDVVFKEDSVHRFNDLVCGNLVSNLNTNKKLIYFDLAGGFDLNQLHLSKVMHVKGQIIEFLHPATNTTCSYLISRDLANYFLNQIYRNANLRYITIDWLINLLFLKIKNKNVFCLHFNPSIFIHGSSSGFYDPLD
jgi:hypothetical protein